MRTLILLFPVLLLSTNGFSKNHRHSADERRQTGRRPDIHSNIVTVQGSIGGIGGLASSLGLEYERFFTKKKLVSASLAVSKYQGGSYGGAHSGQVYHHINGYYAAPGVRLHPFGNRSPVDPSIGAFVLLGHEKRSDSKYGDQGYSIESRQTEHFLGALLGQLNVTFHKPGKIPVFGLFTTGGYIFSNTTDTYSDRKYPGDRLYLQFGMRIGGHW